MPAFVESIVLADTTQGGISYETALKMSISERKAALKVIEKRRESEKISRGGVKHA